MHVTLLDAGGAGLLFIGFFLLLLFTLAAIVLEALFMSIIKYNLFKKALGDSALVNLASVVVGLLIISTGSDLFHLDDWTGYAAFFGVTVIVEFIVLYLLNKKKPTGQTFLICLAMNLITYVLLYFVGVGFNE